MRDLLVLCGVWLNAAPANPSSAPFAAAASDTARWDAVGADALRWAVTIEDEIAL
jgi:hypothetical protein